MQPVRSSSRLLNLSSSGTQPTFLSESSDPTVPLFVPLYKSGTVLLLQYLDLVDFGMFFWFYKALVQFWNALLLQRLDLDHIFNIFAKKFNEERKVGYFWAKAVRYQRAIRPKYADETMFHL